MPFIWNSKIPIQPMHKADMVEDRTKDVPPINIHTQSSVRFRRLRFFYDMITLILTQLNIFKMVSNLFKFLTAYNNYGVILIMYEPWRSYRARFFRLHLF